jgi:hypothetical protein
MLCQLKRYLTSPSYLNSPAGSSWLDDSGDFGGLLFTSYGKQQVSFSVIGFQRKCRSLVSALTNSPLIFIQLLPSFYTRLLDMLCFQILCPFRSLSRMMWQLSAELLIFSAQSFLQFDWQSEPPASVNIFLRLQRCTPSATLDIFQWFTALLEFVMPFIRIEWWYSSLAV